MKTIMIRDEVYKKLSKIKGKKSFSGLLDELSSFATENNKTALRRVFGILTDKEADEAYKRIKEMRKHVKVRLYETTS